MSELTVKRTVDTVTAEINVIKVQTQRLLLTSAIEIGRRLVEAKGMVPHGEWGKYLEEKVEYSQSTANNLMRLYQEYGDDQSSLFGSIVESSVFGKLTYTKALALLAVPQEERVEFAETHNVEGMSTRELEQAIRERDEKIAAIEKNLEEAKVAAEDQEELWRRIESISEKLDEARRREADAVEALEQAKKNPVVPEDMMARIRREAEEEAAEKEREKSAKARAKLEAELAEAKKKAEEMDRERAKEAALHKAAEEQLVAAQKASKMKNPDVAVFQSLYVDLQETWNRTVSAYKKVQQSEEDAAAGCLRALNAAIEKFRSDLERV